MPSIVPVAKEGYPFIVAAFLCTIFTWYFDVWWLVVFFGALTVFIIAFFRDPERVVPADPNSIVSPADGKVIKVETGRDDRFLGKEAIKISIFMNLFNVHVNRVPATGKVVKVHYNPGKFFSADLDKASLENEQNAVFLEVNGKTLVFNQIAGLIARRIVCYAKAGMVYKKGERFGLIRFGSRLDVYLPPECRVAVKVGDKISAGSSILGYWR